MAQHDSATLSFLLASLELGLKSLDVAISSASAAAVDNLASFYFKNVVQARGRRQLAMALRSAATRDCVWCRRSAWLLHLERCGGSSSCIIHPQLVSMFSVYP